MNNIISSVIVILPTFLYWIIFSHKYKKGEGPENPCLGIVFGIALIIGTLLLIFGEYPRPE
jgi:hypothetical protein